MTSAPKIEYWSASPPGQWFIFEVVRKGDEKKRSKKGRPANVWIALLLDADPDAYPEGQIPFGVNWCWLDLGQHKNRDIAWDHAAGLLATRH